MNKKINYLSISVATLSTISFAAITACGDISYTIMIPQISREKISIIQNETMTPELRNKWVEDKNKMTIEGWLNLETGFIAGGNVKVQNISSILASVSENNILITIKVDRNKTVRFLNNKTELIITIEPKA